MGSVIILTTTTQWIPYIAVAISVLTFVLGQREVRRRARIDYVAQLEHRIEECEKDRKYLRDKVTDLERVNFDLLKRVLQLEA